MSINLKLLAVSIICLVASACTTTTSTSTSTSRSSEGRVHWINVYQLNENIIINSADSRAINNFKIVQTKTNNFGVNKILKNALDHYLLDINEEFGGNVVANATIDKNTVSSDLMPLLIPSITMSDDYSVINVELTAKAGQSQKVYSAKKIVGNGTQFENRQYAINNPIPLKEKIVNALYDVALQYAEDFHQAN